MADETTENAEALASNTPHTEAALGAPPAQAGGAPLPSIPPVITPAPTAPAEPNIQDDMKNILAGIKIPERRADAPLPTKQFDTSLGGAADEKKTDTPPRATPAAPDGLAAVHTLKHDLHEVVEDKKISIVRAAALESEKRGRPEPLEMTPAPKRNILGIVIVIATLVVLGGGAMAGVYLLSRPTTTPIENTTSESLVFSESARTFAITDDAATTIKAQLGQVRSTGGTLGSFTRIIPTMGATTDGQPGTPATFSEFMHAIDAHASDELLRALSDDFFLGLHTVDTNAPVLVIPVLSYDHAFKAMLEWEKTMNADLSPLFTGVSPLVADQSGLVVDRTFTDEIMRNYDVRALHGDSGQIVLYYSFPTRNMLLIAESPYSFTEILSRLQASQRI